MKKSLLLITTLMLAALARNGAGARAAPAAAAPTAITDEDLKSVDTPKPEVRLKGDPDGALTGTACRHRRSRCEEGPDRSPTW